MLLATTLFALLSVSSPASNPVPWPVHIVDGDMHPGGRSPLMVVGSLFTGGHCYREDDGNRVHATPAGQIVMPSRYQENKYSKVMAEYLLGNVRPRPSCNEEETCVFLTSPPLNNGWDFTVDSVRLDGKRWEVEVSYWYDDIKHEWSPGANRDGQMLRLGWLPPGDYTCRLTLTHRFMKADTKRGGGRVGIYERTKAETGEVAFTVGKGDAWQFHPWDQAPTTAVLKQEGMQAVLTPSGPAQQMPFYAARRMDANVGGPSTGGPARPEDRPATVNLVVTPPLDWHKHSQAAETLWERPATALTEGVLVAQVFGGKGQFMGRHDWAEITAVEWDDGVAAGVTPGVPPTVTIRATVWRRAFIDGNKPETKVPAFAVPLETAGLGPVADLVKTLKVNVVWSEGSDNPRGAEFEIRR